MALVTTEDKQNYLKQQLSHDPFLTSIIADTINDK